MIAEIIVDVVNSEVDRVFDYIIPQNMNLQIGCKVLVSFNNRKINGYVINIKNESQVDESKLKPVIKNYGEKHIISKELIDLCFYLKNNFYLRMIDCIRLCIPTVVRNELVKELKQIKCYLNSDDVVSNFLNTVNKNARNQILAVNYLKEKQHENITILNKKFSNPSIKKLIDLNVILTEDLVVRRTPLQDFEKPKQGKIIPTELQEKAIEEIINSKGETVLLHGVTGSGKTEIYLQVIDKVLKEGKTAIMLVPEISLTPQMVTRFRERFDSNIAVLHSGLSLGEKFDEWNRIYSGEAKIVIGARSAVFSPIKNIGVIIIDEEHDNSYVSDSNPRYNTTDVAIFRSQYNNCPLVLGSATPNIESYYYAKNKNYKLVELPVRVNSMPMPEFTIIDMLPEFRSGNTSMFSKTLLTELEKTIKNKKQAILFVNRRGFSSSLMCRDCGYVPHCESCDASLVYHKHDNLLKCHYCGKKYKVLTKCPKCESDSIKLGGVGTERVVYELKSIFKDVPFYRMDNDTTTTKDSYSKILSEFEKNKPSVLVGTQMIAKGHDFPHVTLVGILDADLSLYFGGFRASEKTFQLITQVAGRAGRGEDKGKIILQTYYPKHYVYKLAANYDYNRFYDKEINLRDVTNFPPYSKLVRVLITSEKDEFAKKSTHETYMQLKNLKTENKTKIYFLEAMRSPVGRIKNKFRYQIIMRYEDNSEITRQIYEICDNIKNRNITCFIEINPLNLS